MPQPSARPDPSNAPLGAKSARVRATAARPMSGSALAASLVFHTLAMGGIGWATWSAVGVGPAQRTVAVAVVDAAAPAAEEAAAPEPTLELEAREPTEPELVDVPYVLPRADESRFDPEFTEVREPSRAIAHWMSLTFTDTSAAARAGGAEAGDTLGGEALAVVDDPRPIAPAPEPPPPEAAPESTLAHAVLVHRPDPVYPRASLRLREEGTALLRIHVDETGAVRDVELVRSSGAVRLDRAAAEGVRSWRFQPARRDGAPIATSVLHQITFKLG
jgi:protein TonB